jgi:uncharacterized protein
MVRDSVPEDIYLACGLCCDGTIFADVKLRPGDDRLRLKADGLLVEAPQTRGTASKNAAKVPQPCPAYEGCRCRIYEHRPEHCRNFECLLLKSLKEGHVQRKAALSIIGRAQKRAEAVRRLLRELGDTDEKVSLKRRFRSTTKRLQSALLDEDTAGRYGQLTLAVHDLNLLLSQAFYPGEQ